MMATDGEFKSRPAVESSLDGTKHTQSFLSYSNNVANVNESTHSQVSSGKNTSHEQHRKGVLTAS